MDELVGRSVLLYAGLAVLWALSWVAVVADVDPDLPARASALRALATCNLLYFLAASLVLMLIAGLAWGSLYGIIVNVDTELARTGFWVTVLVTLSVSAVFRHQIIMQLLWIATIYLPLIARVCTSISNNGRERNPFARTYSSRTGCNFDSRIDYLVYLNGDRV